MHSQKSLLLWEGLAEMGSWFIPEGNGFQHLQGLCVFFQGLTTGWLLDVITSISCVPTLWLDPSHPRGGEGADGMRIP